MDSGASIHVDDDNAGMLNYRALQPGGLGVQTALKGPAGVLKVNGLGTRNVGGLTLHTVRHCATLAKKLVSVGTICDASFSTFMLSHWVLGRTHDRLPLAQAVEMMSARNAQYLGLSDRGRLAPGLRAENLSVADFVAISNYLSAKENLAPN